MDTIAVAAARILLNTGAVHLRPEQPFTLTSGKKSPVYVDCRKLISFTKERRILVRLMVERLQQNGVARPLAVAGGETAGIPYAAWLADAYDVPMLYVRKKPKGFGRGSQIEGFFYEGARVLLAEDLATDGGSKIVFVDALRRAGAEVRDCIVVFHYGIYPYAGSSLEKAGIALHSLCQWRDVLALARAEARLPKAALDKIQLFLDDPAGWAKQYG